MTQTACSCLRKISIYKTGKSLDTKEKGNFSRKKEKIFGEKLQKKSFGKVKNCQNSFFLYGSKV